MKIVIEVPDETLPLLEVVGQGSAEAALLELIERTAVGVRRRGCSERAWVREAFGDEWLDELEPDPDAYWRQRPRRR